MSIACFVRPLPFGSVPSPLTAGPLLLACGFCSARPDNCAVIACVRALPAYFDASSRILSDRTKTGSGEGSSEANRRECKATTERDDEVNRKRKLQYSFGERQSQAIAERLDNSVLCHRSRPEVKTGIRSVSL